MFDAMIEEDIEIIKFKCHKPIMRTLFKINFLSLLDKIKIEEIEKAYERFYLSLFSNEQLSDLLFSEKWVVFTIYILVNPKLYFLLDLINIEDTEDYMPVFVSMFEKLQGDETYYEKEMALNTMEWLGEFYTLSKPFSLVEFIFQWPIESYKHFVSLFNELPKLRDEETGKSVFWTNFVSLIENSPELAQGAMEKLSDPKWTLLTIQIILNPCLHSFLLNDFNSNPLTPDQAYEAAVLSNLEDSDLIRLKVIIARDDLNSFKEWVGFSEGMYQECCSYGRVYEPGRMTGAHAAMIESVYTHDRQGAGLPITSGMLALLYRVMPADQFLERLQKIYNKPFLVEPTFLEIFTQTVKNNQGNLSPVFVLLSSSYVADFYHKYLKALIDEQKRLVKLDDEEGVQVIELKKSELIRKSFFAPLLETAQGAASGSSLSRT